MKISFLRRFARLCCFSGLLIKTPGVMQRKTVTSFIASPVFLFLGVFQLEQQYHSKGTECPSKSSNEKPPMTATVL